MMILLWDFESRSRRDNYFIQSNILVKLKANKSIGQKELRQITWANLHLKNKCWIESSPSLQRGHTATISGEENIAFNRSIVGNKFQAIFQINNLNLSLIFSFQILFKKLVEAPGIIGLTELF
jgi:hypothetical protein